MDSLLAFVVLLPLVSALALWLVRKNGDGVGDGLVCLTALAELVLALLLRFAGETALSLEGVLHSGLHFAANASSAPAIPAALCFLLVVLTAPAGNEAAGKAGRLRCALMVGLSGLMGVFYAADLMTLWLFGMVLSLAVCVWVAHPETPAARKAAETCLAATMLCGLTALYGLFQLHHHLGGLDLAALSAEGAHIGLLPALCLLIGLGARAAAFPLHVWLPGAADHGYSGCGALLAGACTAAGLHSLEAMYLPNADPRFAAVLLALGLTTLLFAGLCAVYATGLKRLLVWLSVAQTGLALIAAAFYVVHMAAASPAQIAAVLILTDTALFILAHVLETERGSDDLNALQGAAQGNKQLTVLFALPALSVVGFPGLAGHVSLSQLREAVTQPGLPAGVADLAQAALPLLVAGYGLMAAALLKVWLKVFQQPRQGAVVKAGKEATLALTVLAVLLPALGLLPEPGLALLLGDFAPAFRFSGGALLTEVCVLVCGLVLWAAIVRYLRTDKATGDYVPSQALFSLEDDVFGNLLKLLAFVGALCGRVCYALTELVVRVCDKLLHLGAKDRWVPGKDEHFSHYSKGYVRMAPILTTLSFELLLFGLGVVAVFIYLLV